MSRITDPTRTPVPMIPKSAQAGNPHTAAMDLALSERVICTWFENMHQYRCWPFADPDTAPSVEIQASFTDYTFGFADGTWDDTAIFPWSHPVDADTIRLRVVLASDQPVAGLVLWAESQTLIAAVTTVVGPQQSVAWGAPDPMLMPYGPWVEPDHQYHLYPTELQIRDPDQGLSKTEMALVIKAQWRPTVEPVSGGVAAYYTMKIFSVQAWNDVRDLRDT